LRAAVAAGGITAAVAVGEGESLGVALVDGVADWSLDAADDALETGPSAGWLLNRPATDEDDDPQAESSNTQSAAMASRPRWRTEPRIARGGMGLLSAEMVAWSCRE
jgi:hypothetical protein